MIIILMLITTIIHYMYNTINYKYNKNKCNTYSDSPRDLAVCTAIITAMIRANQTLVFSIAKLTPALGITLSFNSFRLHFY